MRKRSGTLIILLGLVIALVAGLLVLSFTRQAAAQATAQVRQVYVVIAARDIAEGTAVSSEALTIQPFPADFVPEGAIPAPEQAVGKFTVTRITKGQIVLGNQLSATKRSGNLALSVPSPLLVSSWTALNHLQVLSAAEVDAEQWIVDHTPQASVFVTNGWLNSPTDAAGRLRLMTFSPYVANLGYDPDERLAQIDRIYCGNDPADAARIARSLGAGYLLDTGPPRSCAPRTEFEGAADWTLVFSEPGVRIFVVAEAAATSAAPGSVSFVR